MARKAPDHDGHHYTEQRGKQKWFCWRISLGGRQHGRLVVVRRKTDALRREAVKEKRKELEAKGYLVSGSDLTVKQHLAQWLEHRVKPNRSPKTYSSYEQICRLYIYPSIGVVKVSKLTALHMQRIVSFVQGLELSNTTARYAVRVLCTCLGRKSRELVEDVELPAPAPPRDHVFSREEVVAIIKECHRREPYKDPKLKGEFYFVYGPTRYLIPSLLNTGLRISEGLGLLVVDLLPKTSAIDVNKQLYMGKEGKWELRALKTKAAKRVVPLNRMGVQIIKAQLTLVEEMSAKAGKGFTDYGLLFPSESGRPLSPRNVQRTLDTMLARIRNEREKANPQGVLLVLEADDAQKMNFEHCGIHDLRRTYVTHLASVEPLLQNVMKIAGHSNVQTTMRHYIWAEQQALAKTAAKLEFEPPSAPALEAKNEETGD